ncbi:MAG TPA: rhodanese-like domain-containing protein [Acidimicrobiales bacterium]
MPVPEIDIERLAELREQGAVLIDVRNPDEFERFRVPGARLIPLPDVPERIEEIPSDQTVYVICATGNRSKRAVEFLNAQGHDTVNVAGGSQAWAEAGHPVESGPG